MFTTPRRSAALLVTVLVLAACDARQTVVGPSEVVTTVDGVWSGTATDDSGPGHMTWRVRQSDGWFSGSVSVVEDLTETVGFGSVTGTREGMSAEFTVIIPRGGFSAPYGHCSATLSGTAHLGTARITATFSGTNTCSGAVSGGQFELVRS